MKYSQHIGFIASVILIIFCFQPWVILPTTQAAITGVNTIGTRFGKPALVNLFFSFIAAVFFLIPKIWSKRANLFMTAINLAWAIRNYVLVSTCSGGECPEKKAGLYILVIAASIMLLMSLLPKIEIPDSPKK
jgi:hypothetical protein